MHDALDAELLRRQDLEVQLGQMQKREAVRTWTVWLMLGLKPQSV